jgi:small subunit ribosomal protein S13
MTFILFGHVIQENKQTAYALKTLYGLGLFCSKEILRDLGILPTVKIYELTKVQKRRIKNKIKKEFLVEGGLEEENKLIIQKYKSNGSRRGYRLRNGLPVNGQRTHSNGKTARKHLYFRKQ